MLKNILLVSGTLLILLLVAVWAYLLLFGTPSSLNNTFADLGLVAPTTERPLPVVEDPAASQVALDGKLQQLTTRQVAGYIYLTNGTSSATTTTEVFADNDRSLRYAERGTGHIYEINLTTGTETRMSGTTIGQTVEAHFSVDGNKVVLISESEEGRGVQLLSLGGVGNTTSALPVTAANFNWYESGTLGYTVSGNGVSSYFELSNGDPVEQWSTPMEDILVYHTQWGEVVVNKPSTNLKSGVFLMQGGEMTILVEPQYGLFASADINNGLVAYSFYESDDKKMINRLLNLDTNETVPLAMPAVPGKCSFLANATTLALCATSENFIDLNRDTLNSWYTGELVSTDALWTMKADLKGASLETPLSEQAGFVVDVIDLKASQDGQYLFFRNKVNDALWMYKLGE